MVEKYRNAAIATHFQVNKIGSQDVYNFAIGSNPKVSSKEVCFSIMID